MAGLPKKDHLDELLDEALAATFPASDPVSALHATRRPPGEKGEQQAEQQDVGKHAVDEPGGNEGRRRRPR
jgi:hypothetical protein